MKKVFCIAAILAITVLSCGSKEVKSDAAKATVDTTKVDTTKVDTAVVVDTTKK